MKYSTITVEQDQHLGVFYIDISVRDRWFEMVHTVTKTRSSFVPHLHDEIVMCRSFEFEQGVRWEIDNEYEAVCMAALVQEGFNEGLKNIESDPEFAVMQFDYITAAHEPALPYAHLVMA